jgi:ribosomal protein L18E
MMVKIKSDRALKYALELIVDMMDELNISRGEVRDVDYRRPYEATEQLVERGLIKIISIDGEAVSDEPLAAVEDQPAEEPIEEVVSLSLDAVIAESLDEDSASESSESSVESDNVPVIQQVIHADAKEVDLLVTDEEAVAAIEIVEDVQEPREGKLCEVNLDSICEHFNDGDTVSLEALKACGLAPKNAGKVKILARGVMTKTLTVYADRFSLQAVKMIMLAGGHAEQYK